MEPITLTDGDLTLRPWDADDVEAVFTACQDPEIQRWTTIPSPYSREDAEWFVSTSPDRWESGEATFAAVDSTTGALLGSFGIGRFDAVSGPEIGYWVSAEARGRGVATRAVRRMARWAFEDMGSDRVVWRAYVGNVGSRAVVESVGFRVEGIERRGIVQRGQRRDNWLGSLLPEDLARAAAGTPRPRSTLEGWPDSAGHPVHPAAAAAPLPGVGRRSRPRLLARPRSLPLGPGGSRRPRGRRTAVSDVARTGHTASTPRGSSRRRRTTTCWVGSSCS